jgi:hypothetical protein
MPRTVAAAAALLMLSCDPLWVHAQTAAKPDEVALIGCIELERDYRARKDAGKGGVLGTGVGVGNEFVLTNAKPASRGRTAATAGTSGADYELTGKLESGFLRHVGRQVEVIGVLHTRDDRLPEIEVTLWHPVGDFCPAKP